jgi:hypothetical protein
VKSNWRAHYYCKPGKTEKNKMLAILKNGMQAGAGIPFQNTLHLVKLALPYIYNFPISFHVALCHLMGPLAFLLSLPSSSVFFLGRMFFGLW